MVCKDISISRIFLLLLDSQRGPSGQLIRFYLIFLAYRMIPINSISSETLNLSMTTAVTLLSAGRMNSGFLFSFSRKL